MNLIFWYTFEMPLNFSHSIGKKLQKIWFSSLNLYLLSSLYCSFESSWIFFPQVMQEQNVKYIKSCKISDRNVVHVQTLITHKIIYTRYDLTAYRTILKVLHFLKYRSGSMEYINIRLKTDLLFRFENMIELFSCLMLLRPHVNYGSHARWELRNEKINRLI